MMARPRLLWLAALLVLPGCGLSRPEPLVQGSELARAIDRRTDFRLRSSPPPPGSASVYNLKHSYAGEAEADQLLVLVFDSPRATSQATGSATSGFGPTKVARQRNALLLYRRGGTENRLPALRASLRAAAGHD